jgi:hypothetical protein
MVRPEIAFRDIGQPLVASPNQTMTALGIGRAKLYELLNKGDLESYVDGHSRKIMLDSIHAFISRRLEAERLRRAGLQDKASGKNRAPGNSHESAA